MPTQPSNGGEPSLSRRHIQELAEWYADEGHRRHNAGTLDALDAELRAILREEVAFPEHVEIEFERGHAGWVCGSVILARPCP